MKLQASLAAMTLALAGAAEAQDPAPAKPKAPDCTGALHRQFDFWIGDWAVTANGKKAGENRIEKILDGCALLESWTGAKGHQGKSLNFYDTDRDLWHQTWIDQQGMALGLDGKFADGKMTLIGKKPNRLNAVITTHRVTWTPLPSGEVRQYWEASTDDGKTWEVQFDGIYKRKRQARGSSVSINVILGPRTAGSEVGMLMGSELMQHYASTAMPTYVPGKPRVSAEIPKTVADSPLCHVSVGRWMKAANKPLGSPERMDRCARLTASMAHQLVTFLNAWKDGKYKTRGVVPAKAYGIQAQHDCSDCHTTDVPSPPSPKKI